MKAEINEILFLQDVLPNGNHMFDNNDRASVSLYGK